MVMRTCREDERATFYALSRFFYGRGERLCWKSRGYAPVGKARLGQEGRPGRRRALPTRRVVGAQSFSDSWWRCFSPVPHLVIERDRTKSTGVDSTDDGA